MESKRVFFRGSDIFRDYLTSKDLGGEDPWKSHGGNVWKVSKLQGNPPALGIQSHSENGFMEPKYYAFRFGDWTPQSLSDNMIGCLGPGLYTQIFTIDTTKKQFEDSCCHRVAPSPINIDHPNGTKDNGFVHHHHGIWSF